MEFILAQICGGIALITAIITTQQKTKERILIFAAITNAIAIMQYFFLDARTGEIISLVNVIRCMCFYYYKKKNIKPSLTFLILFSAAAVITGMMRWQGIYSILPIIGALVLTYGYWQDDVKVARLCIVTNALGWGIYNIVYLAYVRSSAVNSRTGVYNYCNS